MAQKICSWIFTHNAAWPVEPTCFHIQHSVVLFVCLGNCLHLLGIVKVFQSCSRDWKNIYMMMRMVMMVRMRMKMPILTLVATSSRYFCPYIFVNFFLKMCLVSVLLSAHLDKSSGLPYMQFLLMTIMFMIFLFMFLKVTN